MKKYVKTLLVLFGAICLLFFSAVGIIYFIYPPGSWKYILVDRLEKNLGAKVEIEEISYSLTGSLVIKGVQIFTEPAPASNIQPGLRIDAISVLFHPASLWQDGLKIYSIEILDPKLRIIELGRKKYNWSRLPMVKRLLERLSEKKMRKDTKPTEDDDFLLKGLDVQKIFIKDLNLDLNAPSIIPSRQNYLISMDIGLYKNQFIPNIKIKLKKESSVELSARLEMPATLAHLIKNYNKIEARFRANNFPRGEVNLHFKNFDFSSIKQLLDKNFIILKADGNISLIRDQSHKKIVKAKFSDLFLNFGKGQKFLSVQVDGTLGYNTQQKEIKGRYLKIMLTPDQNINIDEIFLDTKGLHTLDAEVDLSAETLAEYLDPGLSIKGYVIGKIKLERSKGIKARLDLNNISFFHNEISFLENSSFIFNIQDDQISIPKSNIIFFKHPMSLTAQGSFSREKGIDLKYKIYGNRFDSNLILDVLSSNGSLELSSKSSGEEKSKDSKAASSKSKKNVYPIKVQGDIHFKEALVSKIKFDDLKASLDFEGKKITLNPLDLSLAQGSLKGKYQLVLGKTPRHYFSFQIKQFKANRLIDFFDIKDKIYASFNGSLKGTMRGADFASLTKSLEATLNLKTSTGKLVNTFLQGGLLNGPLGSLERKLYRLEFSEFSADAEASEGEIYVERVKLRSSDLELNVIGKFDWNLFGNGYMNLKFTNSFIENVAAPARLGILNNYQNGWYQLPFSCIQENIRKLNCWEPDW